MAWSLTKNKEKRDGKTPFLTLAGWGFVAITSFVVAFMALQFSEINDGIILASSNRNVDPEYTGSIGPRANTNVGVMRRGAATGRPSKTQELSTDVDLLRKELVALRRTVSSMRETRSELATRLAALEKAYQGGASTTADEPRQSHSPAIPPDPLPLTRTITRTEMPPIPPIPKASPTSKSQDLEKITEAKPKTTQSKPSRTVKLSRSEDDPELITASIPKNAGAPEPAIGDGIEKTSFGVDLGGFSTLATLSKGWTDLKSDQKPLLGDLAPRAILSDKNGRLEVRLVAGPFNNAAHAITLCAQLQAKGRSCQPSLFVGQPVVTE